MNIVFPTLRNGLFGAILALSPMLAAQAKPPPTS